jgi:hypothetical protein
MSFGIPELAQFQSNYARRGFSLLQSRVLDLIPTSDPNDYSIATALKKTLTALDAIARINLRRSIDDCGDDCTVDSRNDKPLTDDEPSDWDPVTQAELDRNINTAFRSYMECLAQIAHSNDNGGITNPKLAEVFFTTGKFLYQGLEPLLSPKQKHDLSNCLKSLHTVVTTDHLPDLIFKPPGLYLAEAYSEYNDLLDDNFKNEFYETMGKYCHRELFPQILDQGFDLPSRIILDCSNDPIISSFEYIKRGVAPDKAFYIKFQEQFVNKLYEVGLDMLENRGCHIDGDEALKAGLFKIATVAISSEYATSSKKRAEQITTGLKQYNVENILERIYIEGLELNRADYLTYQLCESLFTSMQFEIKSLVDDLSEGSLLEQDYRDYAQSISRGITLINSIIINNTNTNTVEIEPSFKQALDRFQETNDDLKLFANKFMPKDKSDITRLANETLDRYILYTNSKQLIQFDGFDEEEITDQLSQLATDETWNCYNNDELNLCFRVLFGKSVSLIIQQMLLYVDPLDFRNLSSIHAHIEMDRNCEQQAIPRIILDYSFKDSFDERYRDYFRQRYDLNINGATYDASKMLEDNVERMLHLDWTKLDQHSTIPINSGIDLRHFHPGPSMQEFSEN